jgi:hypothetical protein
MVSLPCTPFPMAEPIRILTVEREDEDGLIVTFSDGTTAGYVIEELLELRPFREPTESKRSDRLESDASSPENVAPHPNAMARRTAVSPF